MLRSVTMHDHQATPTKRPWISLALALSFCVVAFLTGCGDTSGSAKQSLSPAIEPIIFVHISDTHFDTKTETNSGLSGTVDLTQSGPALMSALITQVIPVIRPIATVHTGDMVEKGYITETWQTYSNLLRTSMLTTYSAYVDIPGNHDVKVLDSTYNYADGLKDFILYSQTPTPTRYGYTTLDSPSGPVRLIRTNTADSTLNDYAMRNWENIYGYFPDSQQQALYSHPDRDQMVALTVVLGHSPVAESYLSTPEGYAPGTAIYKPGTTTYDKRYMYQITDGNERMKQLIETFKVPIYFCGHVHTPGLDWLGSKALVVTADTFGAHGTASTFNLVAYDPEAKSPAVKLIPIDAANSPSVAWPIIIITAPANSTLAGTNPNAVDYSTASLPKLRAMVFSPSDTAAVKAATYVIDGGVKSGDLAVMPGGRVWEGQLNLQGLMPGTHVVSVIATLDGGQTGSDDITITVK